jgi:DNA recombination protein RmuC
MIVGLVIGLLVGAAGAWLVLRAQYAGRMAALEEARASLGSTLKALAADALATNNQSFVELAKSQLEQLRQQTTQELEQRKQAVEHLVTPIAESLQKVDGKLQQLEVARTRAYSELSVQVRQLAEGRASSAARREPGERPARPAQRPGPLG